MKAILTQLLRIGFGAATLVTCAAGPGPKSKLNVLLILSDDHCHPHVGCYGNPDIQTPNLDQFAAQGMRFDLNFLPLPIAPEQRNRGGNQGGKNKPADQ